MYPEKNLDLLLQVSSSPDFMRSQLGLMHRSTRNARAQPEEWISTSDAKPHQPDVAHERILTSFTTKIETRDAMTMSLSVVARRVFRVKKPIRTVVSNLICQIVEIDFPQVRKRMAISHKALQQVEKKRGKLHESSSKGCHY